jgi:hypothetical protein
MVQKKEAESESGESQKKGTNEQSLPEGGQSINGADTPIPMSEEPTPVILLDYNKTVTNGTAVYGNLWSYKVLQESILLNMVIVINGGSGGC